jgi:predicted molibdopterin-dependent oxidoreductase YjgC
MSRMVDNPLAIEPSGYLPLLAGILKIVVEEEAFDKDFVARRCNGFESLKESLADVDLEKIIELCGLSRDRVKDLVSQILTSKRGCILYGPKILESSNPQHVIRLLFNILLLRGSYSGLIPLRIEGNEQGAGDMGALPNFLPGYRDVFDKDAMSELEEAWSAKMPTEPGVSYSEMIRAASKGTLKALYITGGWMPDKTHLSQVDFLVLHGIYPSPLFEIADVVFPAAAFTEEEGTITSLERRVQCLAAVVKPVGMAMPDWKIICMIAERMNVNGFGFMSTEEVFDEICRVNPLISGYGIWSLRPLEKFVLTAVEELVWKESEVISDEPPPHYRGVDITEKVHDLKLVYEKVLGA